MQVTFVRSGLILLVGLLSFQQAYAETLYVRSIQGKLLEKPNFKANKVASLTKGDAVTVIKRKRVWVHVSTQGHDEGWISKFLLVKTPPTKARATSILNFDKADKNLRRRASVITTAAAARGLTAKEQEEGLNRNIMDGQDFNALKLMESYRPTQSEIQEFIESIPRNP